MSAASAPLFKADTATMTVKAEKSNGSLRVTYGSWDDAKVIAPDEYAALLYRDGQVHLVRMTKEAAPEPPAQEFDCYGDPIEDQK